MIKYFKLHRDHVYSAYVYWLYFLFSPEMKYILRLEHTGLYHVYVHYIIALGWTKFKADLLSVQKAKICFSHTVHKIW